MNSNIQISNFEIIFQIIEDFELCLIILSVPIIVFGIYVCVTVPLFHVNYIRLVECLFLAFIVSTIARPIILTGRILGIDSAEIFLFYAYMFVLAVILCMAIERSLATIKLQSYENWRSKKFTVLCVVLQLTFSTITTVGFYKGWFTFISLGITLIVCTLLFGGIMFFIDIWTKKCYKNLSNYTLSERFQIAENMRVARIMKRSIFLITLGNLIIFPIFLILYFFDNESLIRRIFTTAANLMIVTYKIIFALIGITSTDIWKRVLIKKFNGIKSRFCFKISSETINSQQVLLKHLKTSDGRRMTFSINEEGDLYFRNLENTWSA